MPRNNKMNLKVNSKNLMKSSENIIICVLVCVLIALVVYYVYKNNNEGFQSEKPTLMFFYVDWCPHCTKAKPEVEKLNNNNVNVKLVNCDKEKELANQYNIRAYPTVILKKGNDRIEYNNRVTKDLLEEFVRENL